MKNIAVILAGGEGLRSGMKTPKQFVKIAGKMVIEHTLQVFQNNVHIDEIAVVCHPSYTFLIERIVADRMYHKVKKILNGGAERYHSSLAAIHAYAEPGDNLIFHDAVRPLLNDRIIDDVVEALRHYNAVDVAIPTTDTIIKMNPDGNQIESIPQRKRLQRGQTPQAFRQEIIKKAYDLALQDPQFVTTDDCGVVKKYLPDEPIYVVRGEESNMKLTYPEDFFLIDKLFQLHTSTLTSQSLTVEEEAIMRKKVFVVFGGSKGIGESIVQLCEEKGAKVFSFSRSQNGVDIKNAAQVRQSLQSVYDQTHRIDAVINTAGILHKEPFSNMDYQTIVHSIDTNYLGCITVSREAFPFLKESHGDLLLFTSSSYTRGRAYYSIYSSLKAAIVNFTQAISEEWAPFFIQVNCINPERTKTPMRVENFGIEDDATLLDPQMVAITAIKTVLSELSGQIVDVRIQH